MSGLFYIIDSVSVMLEIIVAFAFFEQTLGKQLLLDWKRKLLCFSVILALALVQLVTNSSLTFSITLFVIILVVAFTYRASTWQQLLFSAILIVLFILAEMVIGLLLSIIFHLSVDEITANPFLYMQGVLMSKLFMFAAVKSFHFFSRPHGGWGTKWLFVPLVFLPLSTFLVVHLIGDSLSVQTSITQLILPLITVLLLIGSNVLLFYFLERQLQLIEQQHQDQLVRQQIEFKTTYYKSLSEKQRVSNKAMHDLKNELLGIRELLNADTEQGMEKLDQICDAVFSAQSITFTGNDTLDGLISTKQQQMQEMGIVFAPSVHMPATNCLNTLDLCVVLGNLLDNAIEAAGQLPPDVSRRISMTITQVGNYLSLTITNPVAAPVAFGKDGPQTTKSAREQHGFGLKSVREIVEKYNGTCAFDNGDGTFSVIAMMQN